ncbi:hypothetical protein Bhyg_08975 [Pseudolycoriella hygida]|uniref:Chitin-binding type-1 domain-containing protein n=1 Tax=Pseudolycoriella hygida TaxID=35572 RepID=A0A9Q0S5G4_9DIPT|nr:hypothetical protein Bhyg_08975 [Pseudolycoriella hygida]
MLTIVTIVLYFVAVAEAQTKIPNGQCYENRECFRWCTEIYGNTVGTCDNNHNCICAGGHRDQNGIVSIVHGVNNWIGDKLEEGRKKTARDNYNKGGRQAQDWYCGDVVEKRCTGSYSGQCCSSYGACGTTEAYCGNGCQPDYGPCWHNQPRN